MLGFALGAGIVLALVALASIDEIGIAGIAFVACAVVPGLWLMSWAAADAYGCTTVLFIAVNVCRNWLRRS
jgi:hypothetical protein